MLTIKGTCNEAVVFADRLDPSAEGLLKAVCNAEYLADCKIRIMPDVHEARQRDPKVHPVWPRDS